MAGSNGGRERLRHLGLLPGRAAWRAHQQSAAHRPLQGLGSLQGRLRARLGRAADACGQALHARTLKPLGLQVLGWALRALLGALQAAGTGLASACIDAEAPSATGIALGHRFAVCRPLAAVAGRRARFALVCMIGQPAGTPYRPGAVEPQRRLARPLLARTPWLLGLPASGRPLPTEALQAADTGRAQLV